MAGKFTVIPQSTFEEMQMDAGVLLNTFNPAQPTAPADGAIICATTGGITATCAAEYSDLGEDVDNCPNNMKELKHLDGWNCSLEFTSLGTSPEAIKLALGAADIDGTDATKIVPRRDLDQDDFTDIWWVGDRADGGMVAIQLLNALSTEGFSIETTKSGKGQIGVTLTGHVSIDAQDVVPMVFYSASGDGLDALRITSFGGASGKTSITVSGHTPSSSESYKYKLGSASESVTYDQVLTTGWTSWDGSSDITATTGQIITVAVVKTSDNKAKAAGHVMVTATAS